MTDWLCRVIISISYYYQSQNRLKKKIIYYEHKYEAKQKVIML